MNQLFGKHPGFRSAHAKGIVCEGEFTPAASAATLSKAPHLQGKPVKATVRFSDSTGIPDVPDGLPDAGPHGMAVRFHLPGGGSTDIVANAFNGFAVATGEEFLALLKAVAATGKDAPKPTPLEKFLTTHPKAMKVATAPKPAPASFATEPYFGVNAFEFTNADGKSRFGRYQLRPEAGAKFLTTEEAARKPPNFLIDELGERLAKRAGEVPPRRAARGRGRHGGRRDGRLARRPAHGRARRPVDHQARWPTTTRPSAPWPSTRSTWSTASRPPTTPSSRPARPPMPSPGGDGSNEETGVSAD